MKNSLGSIDWEWSCCIAEFFYAPRSLEYYVWSNAKRGSQWNGLINGWSSGTTRCRKLTKNREKPRSESFGRGNSNSEMDFYPDAACASNVMFDIFMFIEWVDWMRRGQVYRLKTNIGLCDACFGNRLLDIDHQSYRVDICVEWTFIIFCRYAVFIASTMLIILIILSRKKTITISGKSRHRL